MSKKTQKTITVTTDEKDPVPAEIMAEAIVSISDSMKSLDASRLSRRALLLLIHDNCKTVPGYPPKKPGMKEIEVVLNSISSLKKAYVK